jgi:hypothetical protein
MESITFKDVLAYYHLYDGYQGYFRKWNDVYELIEDFLQGNTSPAEVLSELKDICEEFDDSVMEEQREFDSDSEYYVEYK